MTHADIDVQQALSESDPSVVPSQVDLQRWVDCVLVKHQDEAYQVTIRFVEHSESQELNSTYRNKPNSTNVLSFPFENPPGVNIPLLGDVVVCVPVILHEAKAQNKSVQAHFAHMIVHGCLHLLGYDHINQDEAQKMESLEINILAELGIDDPYQEH